MPSLTTILVTLVATQATLGLLMPRLYRDEEWIKATCFGNDWITLLVAVPLLLTSHRMTRAGSIRGELLWIGTGYAVYNYAFYLFGAALRSRLARQGSYCPVIAVCAARFSAISRVTSSRPLTRTCAAGAHAQSPVPPEPAPGMFVGCGRAHDAGQQCALVIHAMNGQGVDGLRKRRLSELAEFIHGNGGQLDDGQPELPHQPEGDFVVLPLTQEHPAAGLKRNVRQITQSKALRWTVWQFTVTR
jgi:hypothetical protein